MAEFSSSDLEGMGEETGRDAAKGGTRKDESSPRLEEPGEVPEAMEIMKIGTHSNESVSKLEDQEDQLIPKLSNAVVFEQIVPKLPWNAFHKLSSVSRSWQLASRNRQVYDARVRNHSTETHVVCNHRGDGDIHAISLFSMRDESWHQLPAFPFSPRGIPRSCQCVSLDGKLYILGGLKEYAEFDNHEDFLAKRSSEVYVLDLAGERNWNQCATIPEPRYTFGCGVWDGKIYLFGGTGTTSTTSTHRRTKNICGSLVYDPKENAWSSIMPMKCCRFGHHVVAVGEELYVRGGEFYDPDRRDALFSEVYHPGKDEWRVLKPDGLHKTERLFTAHGKLYLATPRGIYVHHTDENSWTDLHSFSFADLVLDGSGEFDVRDIHAVNDELVALFEFQLSYFRHPQTLLLRSKGFCSGSKEIVWDRTNCGKRFDPRHQFNLHLSSSHFLCPIQL